MVFNPQNTSAIRLPESQIRKSALKASCATESGEWLRGYVVPGVPQDHALIPDGLGSVALRKFPVVKTDGHVAFWRFASRRGLAGFMKYSS